MKIFLSWSGEKSREVAEALRTYLQDVNQRYLTWLSSTDISAGGRWALELGAQPETADYGIVCLTKESMHSEWVLFEAGVLSKSVSGRVCPYLVDLQVGELTGPLAQFQVAEATQARTWWLLQSINRESGNIALPESRLRKYHDTFWPALESEILRVNQAYRPFPEDVRRDLLDLLPPTMYRRQDIEMVGAWSGISLWMIDWNQAAVYLWQELLQVAVTEHKVQALLASYLKRVPAAGPRLQPLLEKVEAWEAQ